MVRLLSVTELYMFMLRYDYSINILCLLVDVVDTAAGLPLDRCSVLNNLFWQRLYMLLCTLASTHVPLAKPSTLLHRLHASGKLQQLFSLAGFKESAGSMAWRCCAISHDKMVTILCLPCGFFHSSSSLSQFCSCSASSSPRNSLELDEGMVVAASSSVPLCLPLILVQVHLDYILEPLSSSTSTFLPAEADSCHRLDLVASLPSLSLGEEGLHGQGDVLTCVASLHKECYLEILHSALTSQLTLSSQDFLLGLHVCQHVTVSLDMTPLLSALCPHCLTFFPARSELGSLSFPLQAEVLCQLLEAALSKHEWSVCVQSRGERPRGEGGQEKGNNESSCSQSSSELNLVFLAQLTKLGFKPVPGCEPGYFWMDSTSATLLTRHGNDRVCQCLSGKERWEVWSVIEWRGREGK